MQVLSLLLVCFIAFGYSFKLREDEIRGNTEETLERNRKYEKVSEERLAGEDTKGADTDSDAGTEVGMERRDIKTVLASKWKMNREGMRDEAKHETGMKVKKTDTATVGEEEAEGELVAGIRLHKTIGGEDREIEKIPTGTREIIKQEGESAERERRVENEEDGKEATYNKFPVPGSSFPPTTASLQLFPSPAVSVDPVSLIPLTVALQSPGRHNEQKELAAITSNVNLLKPAQVEAQTTHSAQDLDGVIQPNESRFTPRPGDSESKQTTARPKPNERKVTRPPLTTARAQPALSERSGNKAIQSKEKKRNDIKPQNPSEKKKKVVAMDTGFSYFMDNYCPLECACYGRVVQCSDKGVEKVPYGIPYNARYILLMNNHINSIQLDLLSEYVSMEFLVLSNNRLTSGAIEGAFYGVPALKRLYLDRNLLESAPADLPVSLEEIRLDNNRLSAVSQAAWTQCPGLQVLSLSNNSLGGSEPFPNGVFSPLRQLRTLNLDHNRLTSVPLGLPLSIKGLYLKGNLIEQIHGGVFDGLSELVVLDVSDNRLRDKGLLENSLVNATRLESINFEGNRLKRIPRHLPLSLKTLNLEGNLISSIKKAALGALKNLEHLGLARNQILKVAPGAFRALPVLHQLDLSHNALHQVPRQLPPGLHSVALAHNRIRSVPRDAFCWGDKSLSLTRLVRVQLEHNLIDMGKLDAQAFRCLRGFQVVHFY